MENPGEELVGSYLREVCKCDFVEYNLPARFTQGEIDVVGINTEKKTVYLCEVATHLETGLQYTKANRPDNIGRFVKKFQTDITYANKYFGEFKKVFMLWSPIVRTSKEGFLYNQMNHISEIQKTIKEGFGIDLDIRINEEFMKCIEELRKVALTKPEEIKTPILRFLQIEEKLKAHISKIEKRKSTISASPVKTTS